MELKDIFASDGLLAKHFDDYEERPGQVEMAELVQNAIASGFPAVIEGATGIGKSFAYLIPLILAGKKAIISTSNKSLQDQLSDKDLPTLGKILPVDFNWAVLKGKNNYFCPETFKTYKKDLSKLLPKKDLKAIIDWADGSKDGDVEYCPVPLTPIIREMMTCSRDKKHDKKSPFHDLCFANKARERAREAQIILVNHTLLALDLVLKKETDGAVKFLPNADVIIIDEAHAFERYANMALSDAVNIYSLAHFLNRSVVKESFGRNEIDKVLDLFNASLNQFIPEKDTYYIQKKFVCFKGFSEVIEIIERMLSKVKTAGQTKTNEIAQKQIEDVYKEGRDLIERLNILAEEDDNMLRWSEAYDKKDGRTIITLKSVPLDISGFLKENLFADKVVICTSSTLAIRGDFSFFKSQMGVPDATMELAVDSPFDYKNNALIYISSGEQEKKWEVEQLIKFSKGNAFVLFTSYRDMWDFYRSIDISYPKLIQSEGISRVNLLAEFKETPNAVLFGTKSFWEGIDVKGNDLVLVIIHKIPFETPSDLVYQSKIERIDKKLGKGKHWGRYTIPDACLRLKQGVGRLIRCFDLETEVLTTEGWKKYNEIKSGMETYGIPLSRQKNRNFIYNGAPVIEKNKILAIQVNKKPEPMLEINAKSIKACVTPDHSMFVQLRKTRYYPIISDKKEKEYKKGHTLRSNFYERFEAKDLPPSFRLPLAGRIIRKPTKLSKEWFELIGLIISDGYISESKNCIVLCQSTVKSRVVRKIDEILKVLKISPNRYTRPTLKTEVSIKNNKIYRRNGDLIYWQINGFNSSRIRDVFVKGQRRRYPVKYKYRQASHKFIDGWKYIGEKNIPRWCLNRASRPQLLALLDGLMMGDGTWNKHNGGTYFTVNKLLANNLQELLALVGYRNSLRTRKGQFEVTFLKRGCVDIVKNKSLINSNTGPSWCVSTLQGNILVRRKGSTFIAGNSKTDIGVIALLDSRVNFRSYGKRIIESMPPSYRTQKLEKIGDFFRSKGI